MLTKKFTSVDLLKTLDLEIGDEVQIGSLTAKVEYNEVAGIILTGKKENGQVFSQRITYLIDRVWFKKK